MDQIDKTDFNKLDMFCKKFENFVLTVSKNGPRRYPQEIFSVVIRSLAITGIPPVKCSKKYGLKGEVDLKRDLNFSAVCGKSW